MVKKKDKEFETRMKVWKSRSDRLLLRLGYSSNELLELNNRIQESIKRMIGVVKQ